MLPRSDVDPEVKTLTEEMNHEEVEPIFRSIPSFPVVC